MYWKGRQYIYLLHSASFRKSRETVIVRENGQTVARKGLRILE